MSHSTSALSRYKSSLAANPLDDEVRSFHEEYGWWSDSAERLLLGVWSPMVVGATLGVIAFSISAELIGRNRERWIEYVSLPIETTFDRVREEFVLTWRPWSVVLLGYFALFALDLVFPSTVEALMAFVATSIVIYPTWRTIYAAAKDRLAAQAEVNGSS